MRAVVHADDAAKLSMIGPLVGDRNERHIFAFGNATERGATKGENQLVGQGSKFVGLDEEIQIVARNIEAAAGKRRVKMPIVGLFVILRIPTNGCDGQPGCFELFGTERIRSIRDLKGKTVAIEELAGSEYTFISSMMTYVGLDPRKDVRWSTVPASDAKQLLAEGKIDAFLALPPNPQELRARRIGHAVVNSVMDRPWS